jgi:hypothetical protein
MPGSLTVKCKGKETDATFHAKQLIDHNILWCNPTHPRKVRECREDKVGKPVPAERCHESVEKEFISTCLPLRSTSGVSRVSEVERGQGVTYSVEMSLFLEWSAAFRAVFPRTPGQTNFLGSTMRDRPSPASANP